LLSDDRSPVIMDLGLYKFVFILCNACWLSFWYDNTFVAGM
jgi:hypothetical protein